MPSISKAETDCGTRILTVRARTAAEAVAMFHALRQLDAQAVAGDSLAQTIKEADDERASR